MKSAIDCGYKSEVKSTQCECGSNSANNSATLKEPRGSWMWFVMQRLMHFFHTSLSPPHSPVNRGNTTWCHVSPQQHGHSATRRGSHILFYQRCKRQIKDMAAVSIAIYFHWFSDLCDSRFNLWTVKKLYYISELHLSWVVHCLH